VDPLHHDGEGAGHVDELIDLLDVLVDQRRDELGLVDEHVPVVEPVEQLTADGLDADGLREAGDTELLRQKDLAHATFSHLADDPVGADVLEGFQFHGEVPCGCECRC